MRRTGACAVACAVAVARLARAEDASTEHRFGVGVQVGLLDRPTGHLGIPLGGSEISPHLPIALVARYQLARHTALTAGAGLPTGAMGPAVWIGFETLTRLWVDPRRVVALEAYEDSGLQLGFAGPDYSARNDNEFVGYAYAYSGPLAFAVRLPVGFRLCWLRNRFDTFVMGTDILAFTPSVESLFELSAGARLRF